MELSALKAESRPESPAPMHRGFQINSTDQDNVSNYSVPMTERDSLKFLREDIDQINE